MERFKGTLGKWQEHKNAFCCVISDTGILVANCGGRTSNINPDDLIIEQEANSLLISKAPEMLEMLESLIHLFTDNNNSSQEVDLLNEAKKLIKKATEI